MFWLAAPAICWSGSVGYVYRSIGGTGYHVVLVDLHDARVKVSPLLTVRYPGGAEPARALIRRYWPAAAISGTYFCTVSLRPVGDIVIDGRLRHFGGLGRALAITPHNEATLVSVPFGRHVDWSGFESVLAAGPSLVRSGRVWLAPKAEGFSDPDVLAPARRCAVGLTASGKLVMVATNERVSLAQLARALQSLNCTEAINLDGGASACLWYRGRYLVRPGRPLVNILAVFEDVDPAGRSAGMPGRVLMAWRAAKAWELYKRAVVRARDAVDLLARACELDPANASYARALAEALEKQGDAQGASAAYAEAARRFLSRCLFDEAERSAQRACELAPTSADAVMMKARIARARGMTELASKYMQRARALYLLEHVPAWRWEYLTQMRQRLEQFTGRKARPVAMMSVVRGNIAAAGGIGLYVELPEFWQWLPSPHANTLLAERQYMPWLVHVAAVGVPSSVSLDDVERFYLGGTMLITDEPRVAYLGLVPAQMVEARAMAGDEVARYRIILAVRDGLLVVVTFAAPERWWELAQVEFDAIAQHIALAPRR
ncbi:MAG: phosphodiester glycosidase family protein [Armatimonadetes bacterium]|nr:phosphodiester glycosidase family protein [Armatimonadota bacterium]